MPAPRKYPQELRDRSIRLVLEALREDQALSVNQAVIRIGQRVGVKQSRIDAGDVPGTTTGDAASQSVGAGGV